MINEWYKTNDDQWCKPLGERKYKFVQLVWMDILDNDEACYTVVSMEIDLNEYSNDDIEMYISGYAYDSIEDMCKKHNMPIENAHELDELIAECIFEEKSLCDEYIIAENDMSEEAAIKFVEEWIKEN